MPTQCPTCQTFRGQWDEACSKCGFSFKGMSAAAPAAKPASAEGAVCPSCKAPRKDGDDTCPGCGIVYSKWKPREERIPPVSAVGSSSVSSAAASSAGNITKQRPGCLTFMMVASILVNIAGALVLMFVPLPAMPGMPTSVGPLVVISLLTAVCAWGVLQWKSWGVYGLYLLQIASVAWAILAGQGAGNIIQPLIVLALFHYFVNPITSYFD